MISLVSSIVERNTFISPTEFCVYISWFNYSERKDMMEGKTCHGTLFSTSMSLMHKQIIYWFSFIDTSRLSGLLVSYHIFCEDILHWNDLFIYFIKMLNQNIYIIRWVLTISVTSRYVMKSFQLICNLRANHFQVCSAVYLINLILHQM